MTASTKTTTREKAGSEAKTRKVGKPTASGETANSGPKATATPAAPRQTKKQLLIETLRKKNGADLPTLCNATGWQTHTVRAALSRLKAEGHVIAREPGAEGAPARYRITGSAANVSTRQPS